MDAGGDVICHGVVLGRRSILTTAACVTTHKDLSLVIGEHQALLCNALHAIGSHCSLSSD